MRDRGIILPCDDIGQKRGAHVSMHTPATLVLGSSCMLRLYLTSILAPILSTYVTRREYRLPVGIHLLRSTIRMHLWKETLVSVEWVNSEVRRFTCDHTDDIDRATRSKIVHI